MTASGFDSPARTRLAITGPAAIIGSYREARFTGRINVKLIY